MSNADRGRTLALALDPNRIPPDLLDHARSVSSITGADLETLEFLAPGLQSRGDLAQLLASAPRLRVLQLQSAGIDAVPWDSVSAELVVCSAAGVHDRAVAEWCLTAILTAQRRIADFIEAQRLGRWLDVWSQHRSTRTLLDAEVLLLGYGRIATATEQLLAPFGCTIHRVARTARAGIHSVDDLPRLLATADVVVVLTPLTHSTRHLVDRKFVDAMKQDALLVNASRGEVVVTDDLADALDEGRIRAALDVTDPEPLPDGHRLWNCPGLILTSHAAGYVTGFQDRVDEFVIAQARRYTRGRSLENVVAGPNPQ